ncbi:unnamed protein product [Rotaria sp. Silwood1]|nr:unnamed protein product [Rotaria sp. Silwood1]
MEGRKAHFKDGSSADNIDAIIFCTGYRHFYPFMAKRFRLHCDVDEIIPPSLYKSIFWIDQPYLAYLGATRYLYTFPLFALQTALVRDVFLDNVKFPEKDQWQADLNEWKKREEAMVPFNILVWIDLELDYMRDILALLHTHDGNQSLSNFDFDKAQKILKEHFDNKLHDMLGYRDISYESISSTENTKLIHVYKPWLENMVDSIESFLINYREKL